MYIVHIYIYRYCHRYDIYIAQHRNYHYVHCTYIDMVSQPNPLDFSLPMKNDATRDPFFFGTLPDLQVLYMYIYHHISLIVIILLFKMAREIGIQPRCLCDPGDPADPDAQPLRHQQPPQQPRHFGTKTWQITGKSIGFDTGFLIQISMDWFKGKSTGNHGFSH